MKINQRGDPKMIEERLKDIIDILQDQVKVVKHENNSFRADIQKFNNKFNDMEKEIQEAGEQAKQSA